MKRDFMINYRQKHGLTVKEMARVCKCSETLLRMIEDWDQEVTHPNIVDRIAKVYKLTTKQKEMMLPKNYRKSDLEYDPKKYVLIADHEYAAPKFYNMRWYQ